MKKRVVIGIGILLLLGLGVAWVVPAIHFRIRGFVWQESFYRGWPTSFWISALKKEPFVENQLPTGDIGKILSEDGPDAVPVLAEMLADEDRDIRLQALLALGAIGPAGNQALTEAVANETGIRFLATVEMILANQGHEESAELAAVMLRKNPSPVARSWAARILARSSREVPAAMEPLREAFRDQDPSVRLAAAQAFSPIAKEVFGAVDLLSEVLRDQDSRVRLAAAQTLLPLGRGAFAAVAALHESLRDQDFEVRLVAAQALWRIEGEAGPILPVLVDAIPSANTNPNRFPDYTGLVSILNILHELGPDAKEAIRPLQELLTNTNPGIRNRAAVALGAIGPDQSLVPALIEALKDESWEVRSWAATDLRECGPEKAAPALLALLKHRDVPTRSEAVSLLGHVKPASKEIVSGLVQVLKDRADHNLCWGAITALGDIGPSAKDAIPALLEALEDERLRQNVVRVLGAFGQDARAAVPALLVALKDKDESVRISAAASLWQIERRPERVLPVVFAALQDNPSAPQRGSENVAMRIPGGSGSPIPVLPSNFSYVHVLALKTLCQVEPKTGYPLLCKAIQAKDSDGRGSAIMAAGELGPAAKETVPALIQVLRDQSGWHMQAAEALGQIGRAAAEALPALREAAKQHEPFARRAARSAIKLVSGES